LIEPGSRVDDFFEVAEQIDTAETAFDALAHLTKAAARHGFAAAACMELVIPDQMPPDALVLLNLPLPWVEHYIANDFAVVDPVLGQVLKGTAPFTWEEAAVGARHGARRVMNEAADFGLRAGITFPMHGANGYRAELTLAGDRFTDDPKALRALRFLAISTHDRARALIPRLSLAPPPKLSDRERECLHWVAGGKSDWAISQIIGISEATVHWHIERAKRKFAASTRIQAVVAAIRAGELRP
jgi:DNA-binding CsgD family transcriptional regulator